MKSNNTDELILKNIGLVYSVIFKFKLNIDDYYDVGLIGLVKGAKSYDETKAIKPSTYLYQCIKNEIVNELRRCHLENLIRFDDYLLNMIPDSKNIIKNSEKLMYVEYLLNFLTEFQKNIIIDYFGLNGFPLTQKELAIKYKCTVQNISRVISKSLKIMKNSGGLV